MNQALIVKMKLTSTSSLNCSRSSGKVKSIIFWQAGSEEIQITIKMKFEILF